MASDPLPHQPATDALESSTAMPNLPAEAMDNVGVQAARMVDDTVRGKGRKGARKTVQSRAEPEGVAVSEPAPDDAPEPVVARAVAAGEGGEVLRDGMAEAARQGLDGVEAGLEAAHALAETSGDAAVETARQGFEAAERVVDAADAATDRVVAALDRDAEVRAGAVSDATDTLVAFNAAVVEAMRANLGSTMSLWTALLDTRSMAEAAALNREHVFRQVETLAEQNRALLSLAQKMVFEAWRGLMPDERRPGA